VPTRIAKIETDDLAAVVLACAGLDRLGRSEVISERIEADAMLPAVCQGMLSLEGRAGEALCDDLAELTTDANATAVAAERSFLRRLGGDCTVPLAAHCEVGSGGDLRLRGLVASLDGERIVRAERRGAASEAATLGLELADSVLADGGREILDALAAAAQAETPS
jgi:hydroxymethylbilane synthase